MPPQAWNYADIMLQSCMVVKRNFIIPRKKVEFFPNRPTLINFMVKRMKKRLWLMLIFSLIFLTSCGEKHEKIAVSVSEPEIPEQLSAEDESFEIPEVSVSVCTSVEELRSEFEHRTGQHGLVSFENRGSCVSDEIAAVGSIVYIRTDYTVEVCRLDPEGATHLNTLDVGYLWKEETGEGTWTGSEKQCTSVLTKDNRLVVLSDTFAFSITSENGAWESIDASRCTVDIFDISDPENPRWMRSFSQSGCESTCLISEGKLFLVTDRQIYRDDTLSAGTLPGWWQGEAWTSLDCSDIYLCSHGSSCYLQFGVYELERAAAPDSRALVGCGSECLLCERGLYGLVPLDNCRAVYFLPVKNGRITGPVCSVLEGSAAPSQLTGAGDSLCLLQDGQITADGYRWQRHFGDNRMLALRPEEAGLRLSLLDMNDGNSETAFRILGNDFLAAMDEDRAIFTDTERGLIGLSSEDGYSLFLFDGESFSHVLDCYSYVFSGNRRYILRGNLLYITDDLHVFTINLDSQTLIHTLRF